MALNGTLNADISVEHFQRLSIQDRYQLISRVCTRRNIPFVLDQVQLQEVHAPNDMMHCNCSPLTLDKRICQFCVFGGAETVREAFAGDVHRLG